MTEVVPYAEAPLSERVEYARTLASAADLIPTALHDPLMQEVNGNQVKIAGKTAGPNPGKVLLVMETGAMLGLHPIAALGGIHIIEGKPAISSGLMAAVIRQRGHRLRVETFGTWAGGDFRAVATLVRSDDEEFVYSAEWNRTRAETAGLLQKDNWRKYPEGMCKARAIAEVAREGASDALAGIGYTPEELNAPTDDQGQITDVSSMPADAPREGAGPSDKPAPRKRATNGRQGTKRPAKVEPAPEPTEEIVDAEVVEDEPAAVAPEPEAKPTRDVNAAKAPDALEGESEPDYQNRKRRERDAAEEAERIERERIAEEQMAAQRAREEAEPAADPATGEIIEESGDQVAERIKRERAERGAPTQQATSVTGAPEQWTGDGEPWAPVATAPESFDKVRQAFPDDYAAQVRAATTQDQLRLVWNESASKGKATTELRAEVAQRSDRLKAAEQAAPADDGNALAGA